MYIPNWCDNTLIVRGHAGEIKRFKERGKHKEKQVGKIGDKKYEYDYETDLSLNKFFPMPKELENTSSPNTDKKKAKELTKKFGMPDWWYWKVKNWGTKWDIEAVLERDERNILSYHFDSAWSPPIEWLKKISKDFPKLKFTLHYEEPGMAFKGTTTAEKGEVNDKCYKMGETAEYSE